MKKLGIPAEKLVRMLKLSRYQDREGKKKKKEKKRTQNTLQNLVFISKITLGAKFTPTSSQYKPKFTINSF